MLLTGRDIWGHVAWVRGDWSACDEDKEDEDRFVIAMYY